jgi:predicted enzyme related to lactoylglutathione lyase
VCGHRQTGVAEPVQVPGDGSQGRPDEIDAIFKRWQSRGVTILHEPHDAGFGLTFLAADPDGNRIRVAPKD